MRAMRCPVAKTGVITVMKIITASAALNLCLLLYSRNCASSPSDVSTLIATPEPITESQPESASKPPAAREEKSRQVKPPSWKGLYKYAPPSETAKVEETENICGDSPDFKDFFDLSIKDRSANKEDQIIYEAIFKGKLPSDFKGTFLELGAFDGHQESNTRFFESCLGFEGLLIEGNPSKFELLLGNRPRAHRLSFAPSCKKEGSSVKFHAFEWTNSGLQGRAKAYDTAKGLNLVDVNCGPLQPVLEELLPSVTFFSLDVEGAEQLVLDTIDFGRVQIDVLLIEVVNAHCGEECEVRNEVRARMAKEGYTRYEGLVHKSDVYVHPKSSFKLDATFVDGTKRVDPLEA